MSPRSLLEVNHDAGIVTVLGLSGRECNATIEDLRVATSLCDFSNALQPAIDELDDNIEYILDSMDTKSNKTCNLIKKNDGSVAKDSDNESIGHVKASLLVATVNIEHESHSKLPEILNN